jgi:hypothetical protein
MYPYSFSKKVHKVVFPTELGPSIQIIVTTFPLGYSPVKLQIFAMTELKQRALFTKTFGTESATRWLTA